jgi:hypothetical protein
VLAALVVGEEAGQAELLGLLQQGAPVVAFWAELPAAEKAGV